MSMKLDATRHKRKLFQKNRNYRIKNKLYFYYDKPDYQVKNCKIKRKQQKHAQATQPVKKKKKPKVQLNATRIIWTPSESSNMNWTPEELIRNPSDKSNTKYPKHAVINWTACYNDGCFIYFNDKKDNK